MLYLILLFVYLVIGMVFVCVLQLKNVKDVDPTCAVILWLPATLFLTALFLITQLIHLLTHLDERFTKK